MDNMDKKRLLKFLNEHPLEEFLTALQEFSKEEQREFYLYATHVREQEEAEDDERLRCWDLWMDARELLVAKGLESPVCLEWIEDVERLLDTDARMVVAQGIWAYLNRQTPARISKTSSASFWGASTSLQAGDLVRHAIFGDGVVTDCNPSSGDQEVTVQFSESVGVKLLLRSFAPLKKIES